MYAMEKLTPVNFFLGAWMMGWWIYKIMIVFWEPLSFRMNHLEISTNQQNYEKNTHGRDPTVPWLNISFQILQL